MSKSSRKWVQATMDKVLGVDNFKSALEILTDSLTTYHHSSKVWIVKTYGKRESFITGSGNESYQSATKIAIDNKFNLYLQNFTKKYEGELEVIKAMFRIIINIYSDNYRKKTLKNI